MKKCKYCKSEIDSKAKICPNCRKKQGFSKVLGIILIFIGIIIIAAATTDTEETETEKFGYEITSQYSDDYGFSYYIEGKVTNNKDKDYSYVQIEFVCYDSEGNNLGTALDNTNNLLGNETWSFKAFALFSSAEDVDHCEYHDITSW